MAAQWTSALVRDRALPDGRRGQSPYSGAVPDPNSPQTPAAMHDTPETRLRKQLLAVVLRDTIKKTGIPAAWIRGEALSVVQPDGQSKIEVQLSVAIDEPRVYYYLSSIQASYERRLQAVAPDAQAWMSRLVWRLGPDPSWEVALPDPEYWELVESDREVTSKKHGGKEWTAAELHRHFSDTNPGDFATGFGDTRPPEKEVEDLAARVAPRRP